MGERRSKRRERREAVVPESSKREALSQRAGDAVLSGDRKMAGLLERALRHRERVERVTHGFHTYPAGLHPDCARNLLSLAEGPVLDPFCGGGTVLIEAMLAGREALGLDVSPIATLVARARTTLTTEEERTALRSTARKAAEAAMHADISRTVLPLTLEPAVVDWYEPHVLAELCAIHEVIGTDPLLRVVFFSILVKVSQRESDTSNTRSDVSRPRGTTATLFHKKARLFARQLEELAAATPEGGRARVHREDARGFREKATFGLVVTSPPYPGVYDYLPLQRLRIDWLGLDPGSGMREEIGARRNFRADRATAIDAWKADTRKWVRACARALLPAGRLAVVIGDGYVGGKRIDALTPLAEASKEAGMQRIASVSMERWDEGVREVRLEHVAVFEAGAQA